MPISGSTTSSADLSTTTLIPSSPAEENGSTDAPPNSASDLNMADVDIAIIDTGISLTHPDLNVYRNVTFVKEFMLVVTILAFKIIMMISIYKIHEK